MSSIFSGSTAIVFHQRNKRRSVCLDIPASASLDRWRTTVADPAGGVRSRGEDCRHRWRIFGPEAPVLQGYVDHETLEDHGRTAGAGELPGAASLEARATGTTSPASLEASGFGGADMQFWCTVRGGNC